jgi:magnesium transporter
MTTRTQDPNHWFREDGAGGLLDARNREKLRQINMLKTTNTKKKWFAGL